MKKDINMELDIEPVKSLCETMKLILSVEKRWTVPILVEQVNSMVNAKQVIDMSEYIATNMAIILKNLLQTRKQQYRKLCIRCDNRNDANGSAVICYYAKRYSMSVN